MGGCANNDRITEAVRCLDIFMKNWCIDQEETEKQNDLIFNCSKCEFYRENAKCMVKEFANRHEHSYPMKDFGSM